MVQKKIYKMYIRIKFITNIITKNRLILKNIDNEIIV